MIVVAGATGLVGRALVELLPAGRRPWSELSRRPRGPGIEGGPALHSLDVTRAEALLAALPEARAIVHLAGVAPGQAPAHADAEVAAMRALLEFGRARRVERFVFLSACGAAADSGHPWLRAKGEAEALLRASGLPFVILRASVVTAADAPWLLALAQVVRVGGTLRLPLLRGGRVQPSAVGDVAIALASALDDHRAAGRSIEIGRAPPLALDELCDCVAARFGREIAWSKVPFVGRALEEALGRVRVQDDTGEERPLLGDAASFVRLFALLEPASLADYERLLPMRRATFEEELRGYPWGAPPPRPGDPLPVLREEVDAGLPLFIPGEALRDAGERAKLPPAWLGRVDGFGRGSEPGERSPHEERASGDEGNSAKGP
ncbi:MAG: NAD(P)H-binding protein [Planctomycetes bacterium]|nr:NAD(P)H-binding protein [Planctomycetota bacterium]